MRLDFVGLRLARGFCSSAASWKKSASSSQWLNRQANDFFAKEARVQDFKSRAAFKLTELHKKYRLFKPDMTVVDLGFAPGSWSQVAVQMTRPYGRVVGVDILVCQPPPGASAIQGNFLSKGVQDQLKKMLADPDAGRPQPPKYEFSDEEDEFSTDPEPKEAVQSYIDQERVESEPHPHQTEQFPVDLVLSDMCEILPQTSGFWLRSVNDPYIRMANTSGLQARDHGASIDLCDAALIFAIDTLKPGGSFVCKFYTGSEDRFLEKRLRRAFTKVKRDKPAASRKESKEMYFIAIGKKAGVTKEEVFAG